jgi:hypothetical protein
VIEQGILGLLVADLEHFPKLDKGLELLFRLQSFLATDTMLHLLVDGSPKDKTLLRSVSLNNFKIEESELGAVRDDLVEDDLSL